MSRGDRVMEFAESITKFCPVCGRELVVTTVRVELLKRDIDVKMCPDMHGYISTSFDAEGPGILFNLDENLWRNVL